MVHGGFISLFMGNLPDTKDNRRLNWERVGKSRGLPAHKQASLPVLRFVCDIQHFRSLFFCSLVLKSQKSPLEIRLNFCFCFEMHHLCIIFLVFCWIQRDDADNFTCSFFSIQTLTRSRDIWVHFHLGNKHFSHSLFVFGCTSK